MTFGLSWQKLSFILIGLLLLLSHGIDIYPRINFVILPIIVIASRFCFFLNAKQEMMKNALGMNVPARLRCVMHVL